MEAEFGDLKRVVEEFMDTTEDTTSKMQVKIDSISTTQTAMQANQDIIKSAIETLTKAVEALAPVATTSKSGSAKSTASTSGGTKVPKATISPHIDATQGMPFPKYDPTTMTPPSFIFEMEEFLTLKGVSQASWHILVGRAFETSSDIALWWSAKRQTIISWKDFKAAFLSYENCEDSYDNMLQKLFLIKQKLDEPFETFSWKVHALMLRIDQQTEQHLIVDRILNSCLPELSNDLRQFQPNTVEDLVKFARVTISTVNKLRKFEGKPLLRARQTDPMPDTSTRNTAKTHQTNSPFPRYKGNLLFRKQDQQSTEHAKSHAQDSVIKDEQPKNLHDSQHANAPKEQPKGQPKSFCLFCGKYNYTEEVCRSKQFHEKKIARILASSGNKQSENQEGK
ncbi:unnamed protein product [Orchesella dallaii]|uniref:Retrotransposon gag domain-containing protein n=1 Tax=Orchesella dallaii TaxID=48710 RepID=A0ABP1RU54_9HEXA